MLSLTPVSLSEANAFVARYHRHHRPVVGHKFSIGCMADGNARGWLAANAGQEAAALPLTFTPRR